MKKKNAFRILIPDSMSRIPDVEEGVFGKKAEIITRSARNAGEIPEELWNTCDAVIAYDNIKYGKTLLSKLKKCRVIVRSGIGYDNIDIAESKRKGIVACNVPDYCIEEVADHTMSLLLYLARGLSHYVTTTKRGKWERKSPVAFRLKGKVFGMLGFGPTGKATAARALGFGMKVVFYDPYVKKTPKGIRAEKIASLNKMAAVSDVISIHAPLTKATKGIINDKFLGNAKKGMTLINTSRGPIVDVGALYRAMKKGIVKACALDVLPVEPASNSEKIIRDYMNDAEWLRGRFILTPHAAFYSPEALLELRRKAAEEAKRVLEKKKPLHCVNDFFG